MTAHGRRWGQPTIPFARARALRCALILTLALAGPTVEAAERAAGPAERALRAACAADYRRLCRDVGSDASAVEACMKRKRGQVSPGCQDAAVTFGARAKAERAAR